MSRSTGVPAVELDDLRRYPFAQAAQGRGFMRRRVEPKPVVKPRGKVRKQRRSPPLHQRGELARVEGDVARDILEPLGTEAGRDLRADSSWLCGCRWAARAIASPIASFVPDPMAKITSPRYRLDGQAFHRAMVDLPKRTHRTAVCLAWDVAA
jgi:hypothetical protein